MQIKNHPIRKFSFDKLPIRKFSFDTNKLKSLKDGIENSFIYSKTRVEKAKKVVK